MLMKTSVRKVRWVPNHGRPLLYLAALLLWLPTTVGALIAAAEGPLWLAALLGVAAFLAHAVPQQTTVSAIAEQDRAAIGPWGLGAQLWLLCGGAAGQAVRALRR